MPENPLEDIRALRRVDYVMKDDVVVRHGTVGNALLGLLSLPFGGRRLKPRLKRHQVRLRGLGGESPQGDFGRFQA